MRTAGRRDRGLIAFTIFAVLLSAGGIALLVVLLTDDEVQTYGPSMIPTIGAAEPVRIDTDAFADDAPERGAIVALQGPAGFRASDCAVTHPADSPCPQASVDYDGTRLLKRVVALAGDRIAFAPDGRVILNSVEQREDYIRECPGTCGLPVPVTVPDRSVFVAGDNRPRSSDSRIWGAVPVEAIDGRVLLGD